MQKIKSVFLKILYKLLIFKVIVIDKTSLTYHAKLTTFCELELSSNMGPIRILFKEDRRKRRRNIDKIFMIKNFLVELKVPDTVTLKRHEINEKVIIVIKFMLFKVEYNIFAEVLLDIYLNSIMKYMEEQDIIENSFTVKK